MLQDPQYLAQKYAALGDISFSVDEHSPSDGGVSSKVSREVASTLPEVAKKVLGQTTKLVQSEQWQVHGDGYAGNLTVESGPVHITGKQTIVPVGDAESDWTAEMEVKASIPMVGGKIEKAVAEETKGSLPKEMQFNVDWLNSH
jgi:uncharacterized protein YaiE (UPF0345 family)